MSHIKYLLAWLLVFSPISAENSVKLILTNGEVLIGEIISFKAEGDHDYNFRSDLFGVINISNELVEEVVHIDNSGIIKNSGIKKTDFDKSNLENKNQFLNTEKDSTPILQARKFYKTVKSLSAPKSWTGNLKLGMNFSFGDSEYTHTYMRGKLQIQKPNSPHLYLFSGEFNYRETEQVSGIKYVSSDRYKTEFTYRWLFGEKWFLQNSSKLRVDNLKGIETEIQNLTGFGYRENIFKSVELLIGSSIGVKERRLDEIGQNSYFIINMFQELNWNPTPKIKFQQKLNFFQNPNDFDIYNYDLIFSFNYRFTDLLGFEVRYTEDFDNGITEDFNEVSRLFNALTVYF